MPITDALVVWTFIKHEKRRAMMLRKRPEERFDVRTSWTDDELRVAISEMEIRTPFDQDPVLRFPQEPDPKGDLPQP
jgi:hypothetical protein